MKLTKYVPIWQKTNLVLKTATKSSMICRWKENTCTCVCVSSCGCILEEEMGELVRKKERERKRELHCRGKSARFRTIFPFK